MDDLPVQRRVETIISAVKKASPTDTSLAIGRTGTDGALDRLADEIDGLLLRCGERMKAFQSAQETLQKLRMGGDEEVETLPREHALLLDALKENVPDTIYFKDAQGRFLHLSKARVKAFDLISDGEVIGMTDSDFFTEEHARAAFEDEQRIILTGEPLVNKEEKETWPDRPATWVLTTKMPLRDKRGAIVGTFGISRNITERKRAEERYQLLFNSIDDPVLVYGLTPDGRPGVIREVNDSACEKLGYARDELLLMNPLDFLPSETAAATIDMTVRLTDEKRAVWEGSYVTRAGRRVPAEISSHLFDMSGEPAVLSSFRDLTGRKQLEENLESEKALLMTLIDNLPDHVSVKDTESRFLITNTSNALVMGLDRPQDAVGRTDLDFYPAAEAARYIADEQAVMRTGIPLINKEEESSDPQGRLRCTLTSKVPLRNARGEVVGVVCTGRDITARKEAELALHLEAIRRRIFFEEAPDGIVVIGEGFTVVDANRCFVSMLGYSPEEVRRLHPWDWDVMCSTEESMKERWPSPPSTRGRFETQHRRKGGSIFDVEVTFNPATTASGEVQVYCVCRDITERKRADERIQDLARLTDESPHPVIRASLDGAVLYANPAGRSLLGSWVRATEGGVPHEHLPELLQAWERDERRRIETREGGRVLELTITPIRGRGYVNLYGRDVTEEKSLAEKFLQAQKMEAVGRLAGGIAHDFNNLLTVIVGYCEIAKQELVEASPVRARIEEIANATKRAAGLTSKLLAFSRKQILMPRVIGVNDLLRAAQGMIERLIGEDLELETLLDPEAGNIRADPGQIEQVLMNLAVNARDAMPEGGKLTIETSRRTLGDDSAREHPGARAGDYVQVSISDTGHGMGRDVLYRHEHNLARSKGYREIASISQLKAQQVERWRSERLSEVQAAADSPFLRRAVQVWAESSMPESSLKTDLEAWLTLEMSSEPYSDALLLDPGGRILLSPSGHLGDLATEAMKAVRHAVTVRQPVLSDLYLGLGGNEYLDAIASVITDLGQTIAIVDLRANARSYLLPLIQSWPTPSPTAETLLVRAEGNNALFLNELRHQRGAALSLRFPLSRTEIPAVQAVRGRRGVFEGKDYRGVEVLADLRAISDSPWFIVAKVDAREVYEEANYRAGISFLIAVLLILLAGAGTALGFRRNRALLYSSLLQSEQKERELQKEFRTTLYSIGDAVIGTRIDGTVWHMNPEAERLTGWREAEAIGKPLNEVFHIINEDTRDEVENPVHRVFQQGLVVGLANHTLLIARDSRERPIADSGSPIRDEQGALKGVVLVFHDQSTERAARKALEASEERYRSLVENIDVGILSLDASGVITFTHLLHFGALLETEPLEFPGNLKVF